MLFSLAISMVIPLISKKIMDDGLLKNNFDIILKFSLISIFLIILQRIINMLEAGFRTHINSHMSYNLSKDAFKHLLKQEIQFFNNSNTAEIINNINTDVSNISRISDRTTFYIFTEFFRVIGGLTGLFIINWRLTILVVCSIPFRYMFVRLLAKQRNKIFEQYIEDMGRYYSWYGDTIGGIREVKLWGLDRVKIGQFIKKQRNLIKSNIKMNITDSANEFSESFMMEFVVNAIYILGGYMVCKDDLTIGGLFAFITYSAYVTGPIFAILNIGYSFASIIPSAKRLFNFMDMKSEDFAKKGQAIDKSTLKGKIKFENVSFGYDKNKTILKNINFEINSGEKVAIIGSNGSGKSSIINLILRFYKPDAGRILLDDVNIEDLNLKDYRSLISVVSQDVYLFDTTIKENINLSLPVADSEVHRAAKESGADKFIDRLSEKYDYSVGENGSKLSGGEKQKVAVARGLVRDSKILILDEATSNYDVESEIELCEYIKENYTDKTVIVITHKPEILKIMDTIYVLQKGEIVGRGSHDELYRDNISYREAVSKCSSDERQVV